MLLYAGSLGASLGTFVAVLIPTRDLARTLR
jgi:hypothetical protein